MRKERMAEMKRVIVAAVLILIAVALSAAEALYTGSGTRVCIEMLDEADRHMEQNEVAEAQSMAARLDNRFGSQSGVYDVFLFHSEVLNVGTEIAALRRYAQAGETAEFLASSARIKRTLLSIHNTRVPSWENIF